MSNLNTDCFSNPETKHFLNQASPSFVEEQLPQLVSIAASVIAGMGFTGVGGAFKLRGVFANMALNALGGILAGDVISYLFKKYAGFVHCASVLEEADGLVDMFESYGTMWGKNVLMCGGIGIGGSLLGRTRIKALQSLAEFLENSGTGLWKELKEEYSEHGMSLLGQAADIGHLDDAMALARGAKGHTSSASHHQTVVKRSESRVPLGSLGSAAAAGTLGGLALFSGSAMAATGGDISSLMLASGVLGAGAGVLGMAIKAGVDQSRTVAKLEVTDPELNALLQETGWRENEITDLLRKAKSIILYDDDIFRLVASRLYSHPWDVQLQFLKNDLQVLIAHGFDTNQQYKILMAQMSGPRLGKLAEVLKILSFLQPSQTQALFRSFNSLSENEARNIYLIMKNSGDFCADFDEQVAFLVLLDQNKLLFTLADSWETIQLLVPDGNFVPFFQFVQTLMGQKLSSSIPQLLNAIGQQQIQVSYDLENILQFIQHFSFFSPTLYPHYQSNRNVFLATMSADVSGLRRDALGPQELEERNAVYGPDYLPLVINEAMPPSRVSSIPVWRYSQTLQVAIASGDLRGHIPLAWKERTDSFSLARGTWVRRTDPLDGSAERITILKQLLTEEDEENDQGSADVDSRGLLNQALQDYEKNLCAETARHVLRALIKVAREDTALEEKVGRIEELDHEGLVVLKELLNEPDNLPRLIREIPENQRPQEGVRKNLSPENAARLMRSIQTIWANSDLSTTQKKTALAQMLARYSREDVRTYILERGNTVAELQTALQEASARPLPLSNREMVSAFLSEPLQMVQQELNQYTYELQGDEITVAVRAVKGPTSFFYGTVTGECTAAEIRLWRNPNYNLLALMQGGPDGPVVGFADVLEVTIEGRKSLILLGINPSPEFLETVDAGSLCKKSITTVTSMAEAGGYLDLYIPTDPYIYSNRSGIQRAIERTPYPKKNVPTVDWTSNNRYSFDEVFVVWEAGGQ